MTQTGRPAFFRAGGQQAILSADLRHHRSRRPVGARSAPELEVLPIVYGNGMIWLDINPRITAVSQALGITVGGASQPRLHRTDGAVDRDAGIGPDVRHRRVDPEQRAGVSVRRCRCSATSPSSGPPSAR